MSYDEGNYEVGYGKPPLHSRFQKGQSGNPKGRKRKRSDIEQIRSVLYEKMALKLDGKLVDVTPAEAAARLAIKKGLSGSLRDLRAMLGFFKDLGIEIFTEADKHSLDGSTQRRALETLRKLREEMIQDDPYLELMETYREKQKALVLGDPDIVEKQIMFWVKFLEDAPNEVAFNTRLKALKAEKYSELITPRLIKQIRRRYRERNGNALKYSK